MSFDKYLEKIELNPPASGELLIENEAKFGIVFPKHYTDFMLKTNGIEGEVGKSYVVIWPIEQLVPLNQGYEVEEHVPGLIYFGSDGGGEAYAFDKRFENLPIVEFPFESIHIEETKKCSDTFIGFLEFLYTRDLQAELAELMKEKGI